MNKAIFLDKDGTLIENIPYNVNPDLISFTEGTIEALRLLKAQGYLLIVISNQSGVAHGYFPETALTHLQARLQKMLAPSGIRLDAFFFCPHHPEGSVSPYARQCACRKPKPGMILEAAKQYRIDLATSWMVGDILNDVEAGNAAGCKTILIDNGNETEWILSEARKPTVIVDNFAAAADAITTISNAHEKHLTIS